jgi:hypothetical protein
MFFSFGKDYGLATGKCSAILENTMTRRQDNALQFWKKIIVRQQDNAMQYWKIGW